MTDLFAAESYLRFAAALVFVLALIGASGWLLRRLHSHGLAGRAGRGVRRLAVVEGLVLDARRRLVLVRRDRVEHLLLLGPDRDLVIETRIAAPEEPEEP